MKSKGQSIHQIRAIVTHQSSSLNKKNETNEGNMLQSDDVMVPNMRVRKFQIDPKKFASDKAFLDSDETDEESEEDDYDQVPITRKFKVIT